MGQSHIGNTSYHLNCEIRQHCARIELEWVTTWELLLQLTNPEPGSAAGAYQPSRWTANLFQDVQALGKSFPLQVQDVT